MELSEKEIKEIALLARVGVSDEDVEGYKKDLCAVLGYFEKLQEVDTDDVEEMGHITGMENVYRDDVVAEFDAAGKKIMQDNIPQEKNGAIVVTSVL